MEKGGLGSALCFVCPLFEMFLITVENKRFIIIIILLKENKLGWTQAEVVSLELKAEKSTEL